jgi:hypothetical protein
LILPVRLIDHRGVAEASPTVIDELLCFLGVERLRAALLTLDRIFEPAPVTTLLIEDRMHVMGTVLGAAHKLTSRRENERIVSGAARTLADALGQSTLVVSRRVAAFHGTVGQSALRDVWFEACRADGIAMSAVAHDALIATALKRNRPCCDALCSIAGSVLPHLPDPRGRVRSDSVAVFEYLSMARRAIGLSGAYGWREADGVFDDVASRAIRKALRGKRFNPRHAYALQQERERRLGGEGPRLRRYGEIDGFF